MTEELETSKEELESMNEEMQTVNEELQQKVDELNEAYADLENLMAATQIPTLFLDQDLSIRRFTPSATEVFNIQESDTGRSISDLTTKIEYESLEADAREAYEEESLIEREVSSEDGRWYLMRLRPYRLDEEVRGTVAAFIDITERMEARMRLETLNEELEDRVRERTADLEEEIQERERLQREILRMADEERFRLGERLHDGLGQELAGIRMMCQAHVELLEERNLEELAGKARQIQQAVTEADRHTRGLAEEIVPVELEHGDLEDALVKHAEDVEELHDVRVDVDFAEGLAFQRNAATQVYRIVQESVLNAVTHGDCESVTVRIGPGREEEVLLVEVTDDGKGPSGDIVSMKQEGMGIRIMQYRAGLLGGTFEFEGLEDGGTRVRVRIPRDGG
jgi:two-component system CheB/CheR fusion protein